MAPGYALGGLRDAAERRDVVSGLDQPQFAVAWVWQRTASGSGFTIVTCDANELVAPIHPKAMITILDQQD